MRLLLTTDTIGGVWSFTHILVRSLLGAGHTIALVSFGRLPSPAQYHSVRELEKEYTRSFFFSPSEVRLEWMDDNESAWEEGSLVLLRIVQEFDPQLIHSNQICFGRLNSSVPVLVTAHSDVLSWAESTLLPDGIEQLNRTTSAKWQRTYCELIQRGLDEAAIVVAPTRWMAQTLSRIYHLQHVPSVVWNGVASGMPASSQRRLQAVTAGRLWDRGKGLSALEHITLPLPLLIAGEQHQSCEQSILGAVWSGTLAQKDLFALFAESSIYIATSLYEPFGLAPVEAAKQGCAVVARDLPSFREVWGDAALYFKSAQSLQRILNSLASNPRRLRGAQCRSRRRAARYTDKAMTDGYLALYQELLPRTVAPQEPMLTHV